ncbi:aldehyde dehydrogenase family protein [Leucobacter allii]|uniref:aldehyde dehydrogenase family protein n=1 Tax=Leucobacter allii TaxID=2932247 RepID=UPI001FD0B52D|nr:aldehyde dehydrogenase family protein [Leucobacter allii]UOR02484.1 aldehyde dehydrogenase family protein [Leucobacter allii]
MHTANDGSSTRIDRTEFHSVLDGQPRVGPHRVPLVDPARGAEWGTVSWAPDHVREAVDLAGEAFRTGSWARAPRAERADVLDAIGRGVLERVEEIAVLETLANGKPLAATRAEVGASARWWGYYAALLRTLRDESIELSASKQAQIVQEPVGVVALVTPFNGAFSLGTWKLAPALAAGNAVVVKPPLDSPASTMILLEVLHQAGLPRGVVQLVQGGAEVGAALVEQPETAMVSFTGSTRAAGAVGRAVSGRLARFVAEAGGKSAHIVFEDARISDAVTAVVQGGFSGTGQTCVAGSRILVHRAVVAEFTAELLQRISRLRVGDPFVAETHLGPIATATQHARIRKLIDEAVSEGAEVLTGGSTPPAVPAALANGYWVAPTVLRVDDHRARICQTEVFGPVLALVEFDDEAEAIALANDTEFGLAAGFWTQDAGRIRRVSGLLQAGTVWVNTYRGMDWQTPFGGYKHSGIGRENGLEGLREFQETKAVVQEFGRAADPFGLAPADQ